MWVSNPSRRKDLFFFPPKYPEWLWGSPSSLLNRYGVSFFGTKQQYSGAHHSVPSSVEVEKERSCNSAFMAWTGTSLPFKESRRSASEYEFNPLKPELIPICYLLALLAHHFLHVSRIRVKSLTIRLLMSYIYGAPILDVSRSYTTTQHSR